MIQHTDADQLAHLGEAPGKLLVFLLGVGSPLGWLWRKITAAADSLIAGRKASRGWTRLADKLPFGDRDIFEHLMFGIEEHGFKDFFAQVLQAWLKVIDQILGRRDLQVSLHRLT